MESCQPIQRLKDKKNKNKNKNKNKKNKKNKKKKKKKKKNPKQQILSIRTKMYFVLSGGVSLRQMTESQLRQE